MLWKYSFQNILLIFGQKSIMSDTANVTTVNHVGCITAPICPTSNEDWFTKFKNNRDQNKY